MVALMMMLNHSAISMNKGLFTESAEALIHGNGQRVSIVAMVTSESEDHCTTGGNGNDTGVTSSM